MSRTLFKTTLLYRVVQHRGEEVVGRGYGVEVSGEVDVDVLHRHDLAVTASGGSALDSENRAKRRFSKGQSGLLSQLGQGLG